MPRDTESSAGTASTEALLLRRAAARAEAALSVARAVFCTLVLLRFLYVCGASVRDSWDAPLLLVAITLSVLIWRRARRGHASPSLLAASVTIDAVVCALSLLQTVISPDRSIYTGILRQPDIAAQLVMVMASCLRLSPRLAILSGGINGAFAAALIAVDFVRWGEVLKYGAAEVTMHGLLLSVATATAALVASFTRRLVGIAAKESARIQRTRSHLALLAQSQHDAKSLVSAALMRASTLQDAILERRGPHPMHEMKRDLEELRVYLEVLGERTHGELTLLEEQAVFEASGALREVLPILRHRFEGLHLDVAVPEHAWVRFVGGREALQRTLYTLVDNAVQGDGRRHANQVRIRMESDGRTVTLSVEDDGPGFPNAHDAGSSPPLTTKPSGQGVGLRIASQLAEASGGHLSIGTSSQLSGAAVVLSLPAARRSVETRLSARPQGVPYGPTPRHPG